MPVELRPFKELIIEKSEGNPLFIEEIVRALFENGTIVREGDRVQVTRSRAEISIPATVEGIISSRIDRLPRAGKKRPAGTGGHRRGVSATGGAARAGKAGRTNCSEVSRTCSAPSSFTSVRPSRRPNTPSSTHCIHDVAYKSVLQERRKAIHGRTAAAIETLYANRLDDHLEQAGPSLSPQRQRVQRRCTICIRRVSKPMSDRRWRKRWCTSTRRWRR